MGTVELSKKTFRRDGEKDKWRVEQALIMIATGDEARANRSEGCDRSELAKLGAVLESAMIALEHAARLYLPGAEGHPQHGVCTFGAAWGQNRTPPKLIDPDAFSGMRLLYVGDQIAFGVNRHVAWTNLHFCRAEIVDLSSQLRREARVQARHYLLAAARLKRKPWLSFGDAVRATMIDMAKGRERHLAALCTRDGATTGRPPAWLIYVLGAAEAADQQARCASLWGRAEKHLLNELSWGRISGRGKIGGVSAEIPANEWTCRDQLNIAYNSLGVRKNITIPHSKCNHPTHRKITQIPNSTSIKKPTMRGRPRQFNDDAKNDILNIARSYISRNEQINDEPIKTSIIVNYVDSYCIENGIRCPKRTMLNEWIKKIR